jgi:hypothetical protein
VAVILVSMSSGFTSPTWALTDNERYNSGYNHGCSDAQQGGHPYLYGSGGEQSHSARFMQGYNDGYATCSSSVGSIPSQKQNWADVCQTIQNYLLNDCSSYVASSGSLTSEGMRARDCIQGGGLLAGAGLLANLPPLWIIGILERASVMYKGGVCDGIVDWQPLKTDVRAACFFLNIVGVPCLGV